MKPYGIELSFNNREKFFQIPINPESITISDGNKGSTYDIEALGEINVVKHRKLTEYSFESFFPAPGNHQHLLAVEEVREPNYYIELIEEWMAERRPIRFKFIGSQLEINTPVSIESFEWKEVAGSIGDIYYSLSLKKYVFYSAMRFDPFARRLIGSAYTRPNERKPPTTYTMKAGDTLWGIAKSQLGDGNKWRDIQRLNGIKDAEIRRLPVGKVLRLPDVEASVGQ